MARLRPGRPDDLPLIAALQRRASVLAYADIFPPELPPPSVAGFLGRWCDELIDADGRAWPLVAELDEEVVGAVLAKLRDDDRGAGEIWGLSVDPIQWGNGLGPRLFEAAVDRLRRAGATEAVLWVLEANIRARRLYERAGWIPDGATRLTLPAAPEILEVRYRRTLA